MSQAQLDSKGDFLLVFGNKLEVEGAASLNHEMEMNDTSAILDGVSSRSERVNSKTSMMTTLARM